MPPQELVERGTVAALGGRDQVSVIESCGDARERNDSPIGGYG